MNTDKLELAYANMKAREAEYEAAKQAFHREASLSLQSNGLPVKRKPGRPAKPSVSTSSPRGPVSGAANDEPTAASIVEKLLSDTSKKYLFSEIVSAAGGREKRFAVKSKLNKMRKDKRAKFANGYYQGVK